MSTLIKYAITLAADKFDADSRVYHALNDNKDVQRYFYDIGLESDTTGDDTLATPLNTVYSALVYALKTAKSLADIHKRRLEEVKGDQLLAGWAYHALWEIYTEQVCPTMPFLTVPHTECNLSWYLPDNPKEVVEGLRWYAVPVVFKY